MESSKECLESLIQKARAWSSCPEKQFHCAICGEKIEGPDKLRDHLRDEHLLRSRVEQVMTAMIASAESQTTHRCRICKKEISWNRADLKLHFETSHKLTVEHYYVSNILTPSVLREMSPEELRAIKVLSQTKIDPEVIGTSFGADAKKNLAAPYLSQGNEDINKSFKPDDNDHPQKRFCGTRSVGQPSTYPSNIETALAIHEVYLKESTLNSNQQRKRKKNQHVISTSKSQKQPGLTNTNVLKVTNQESGTKDTSDNIQNTTTTRKLATISQKELSPITRTSPSQNEESQTTDHANEATSNQPPKSGSETQPIASDSSETDALSDWLDQCTYVCQYDEFQTKNTEEFQRHLDSQHDLKMAEYSRICKGKLFLDEVKFLCRLCSNEVTQNSQSVNHHLRKVHKITPENYYKQFILETEKVVISEDERGFYTCPICSTFKSEQKDLEVHLRGYHGVIADEQQDLTKIEEITLMDETETNNEPACSDLWQNHDMVQGEIYEIRPNESVDNNVESIEMSEIDLPFNPVFDATEPTNGEEIFVGPSKNQLNAENTCCPEMQSVNLDSSATQAQAEIPNPSWNQSDVGALEERDQMQESSRDNTNRNSFSEMKVNDSDLGEDLEDSTKDRIYTLNPNDISDDTSEEPQQVSQPTNKIFHDSSYPEIENITSDRPQKQYLVLDPNSSSNPDDIKGVDRSEFSTNVIVDDSYLEKETISADLLKTYDNIKDQFFKMDPNDIIDATILVQKSQKNSAQGSNIIETVNEAVEAKMEFETDQEAESVEGNEKEKVMSISNNVKRETKTTGESGNAVKTEEIGNRILHWVNQCTYTCRLCDGEERLVTSKLETWAYHLSTVHKGWTLAAYKTKHGSVPEKVVSHQCRACGESLNHDRAAIVKHLANSHRGLNLFEYYKKYVSEESKLLEQTIIKEESGESGTNTDEKDTEASGRKSPKSQSDRGDSQGGTYVCKFCNKGLPAPAHLKRHMRVHTGEKPFSCTKCDLRFSLKSNLLKHFRRYHSEASAEIVNLIKANKNANMGIDNQVRKSQTSSEEQSSNVEGNLNDTAGKSGSKEGFDIRQDLEKVKEAIDEDVEGGNLTEDDTLTSVENNKQLVQSESDFKKGVVTGLKKKADSWLPEDQNLEEAAAPGPRMKSVKYTSKNDPAKASVEPSKHIKKKEEPAKNILAKEIGSKSVDMKKEQGLNISEKNEALTVPNGNDGVFLEEEEVLETWANACEYTCQDITCDFFTNEYNHFYNHLKETHQMSTYSYVAKHRTIMTKQVTYDCHIEECSTQIIQTRKNLGIHSKQVHNMTLAQYFQLIEFSQEEYLKLCARASGVELKSSEDFESKIDDRDEDADDREMGEFLGQGNIQLNELEWVNACEYSCQEEGCRFLTKEYNALCSHWMNTHKMSLKYDRAQSAMKEQEIMISKKVMLKCQIQECSSNVTQTRRSIIQHIQEHHGSLSLNDYYMMHLNKQPNNKQDNTETKEVSSSEFHNPAFEKWLKFNIDGGEGSVTAADLLKSDINEPQLEDKVFFGKENLEANNFTEPNAFALQKQALIVCQKSGASVDEDTISRITKSEGDKNQISKHKPNNANLSLPSKRKAFAKPKFTSKDWTNQCTFSCKVCQNFKTKKHSKFVWHLKTEHSMSAPAYKNQFGQAISKRVYLTCLICKQKFSHTFKSIHSHMRNNHKLSPEEYYNRFFSKDTGPDPHDSSKTDTKAHEDRRLKCGKYESLNDNSRLEAQFDDIQIHNWAEKCIYECQICKFHKFQTSHRSKFAKHLYKEHKKLKFDGYKNMFGKVITKKSSHKCFLCSKMMTHSYSSIKGHLSEFHQVKIEQYYRDFILGKKREVNNTPEQTKISSAGRGASKNGASDYINNDDLNKRSNKDLPTEGIGLLINQKEIRNWAEKCTHSCQICNDFSTLDVNKFEKHLFNSHNKLKLAGYNKRYRTTVTYRAIHKCEICSSEISHKFDSIRLHLRRQHKVKIEKYFGDFILGKSKKNTGQNQKDSNDKDSRCSKISKKNGSRDSTNGSPEDNLSSYSKEDPNAIARWSEQCVYECKIPKCKGYKTKTRDKFNRHLYKDHNKLTCEGYKQFFGTLISQRVAYKCLLCESVVTHNTKSISGHLKQVHKLPLIKYYNEYILSGAKSKEHKSSEKASSTNKHERHSSPEPSPKKPKVLNKVIKSEENLDQKNPDKLTRNTEDSDGFYLLKDNSWNGFETNQTIQNQQEDILKAQNRTENDNDNSKELSTKFKFEDFQNVSGENSELIVSRGRLSDILGTFKTATNNSDAEVIPSNLLSDEETAFPMGQSPSKGVQYQGLGPKIKDGGTISKPEPCTEKHLEISWMDGCTYNCKLCTTGAHKFNSKEAFQIHVKEQHGVEPTTYVELLGDPVEKMTYFVCRLCQEVMVKDRGEITNHLQNKHKTPPELYRAMEIGLRNI